MISVTIARKGAKAKKFDAVKVFNDYYEKELTLQKEKEAKNSLVKKEKIIILNQAKLSGIKSKSGLITKVISSKNVKKPTIGSSYRDWETDRKSTRLNSSHLKLSRMPSSA